MGNAAEFDKLEWGRSDEAEQSVLGALLLDNTAYDRVADLIGGGDFFVLDHGGIFRVIARLIEAGRPADMVTVYERLRDEFPKVADSIGPAYLAGLAQNVPSSLNVRRYAEVVRERSLRRRLYQVAMQIVESVRSPGVREIDVLLDEAETSVMSVGEQRPSQVFRPLQQGLIQAYEFIDRAHHGAAPPGIPFGFEELDNMTGGGSHEGQLIVVGARPAMGKSAFTLNVCEHAARHTSRWALFFTIEMGLREQALRMLSASSRVNVQRLAVGRINDDEWKRLSQAMERLHDLKICFNEQAHLTVTDIRAQARREMRERGGLSVIAVDYLQLMVGGDSEANRAIQISEITRGLKLLAKELGVPVILLSQLNRGVESRTNKRPMMSDLRDSGSIEQDADVILFIYRDEVYNPQSADKGKAEIIVAKQRNGPVGTVYLTFLGDRTCFKDYAPA